METTISAISQLPATKGEIKMFVEKFVEEFTSGGCDTLRVYSQIKALEQTIKAITDNKEVKDTLLNQSQKYGAKSFDYGNAKFEIAELGVKYDYSVCNDSELMQLESQAAALAIKIETRKEFLKLLPDNGMELINQETGEIYTIYKPVKKSTTGVKLTFNK